MDIPAKVRKKFYQKTYSSHKAIVVARCYFSELSSTITSLDLKLLYLNLKAQYKCSGIFALLSYCKEFISPISDTAELP